MRRLRPLDRALLLILLPAWLLSFSLHIVNAVRGGIVEPSVYVTGAPAADAYPVVRSLRVAAKAERSGLAPGDELRRIGTADLKGVGPIGFFALAQEMRDADGRALLAYTRGGVPAEVLLEYTPAPLPIRFILISLSFALTALVLLLRAPRSPSAAALFRALMLFSIAFLRPWGGPVLQSYIWIGLMIGLGVCFGPLLVYAVQLTPDEAPRREGLWWRIWPWLFMPVGPIYAFGLVGVPLSDAFESNFADPLAMVLLCVLGAAILMVFTQNYRRCDPVGRRRIKWLVYGLYVTIAPILVATAISLSDPVYWWTSDASEILFCLIPLFILIGIARFNLFDINRLISATASYSALLGAMLAGLLTLVPYLASATTELTAMDEGSSQLVLSVALAALIVPARRYVNPLIDRWLFPDRHALEDEIQKLLVELSEVEAPQHVVAHAAERIDELLRPESSVVYFRAREDLYEPVYVRGRAVPPVFDARNPVIATLRGHAQPLAATGWARVPRGADLSSLERALLDTLDVVVLVPVRRGGELLAFNCLGPKRSGDVYTTTDLVLLTAVAEKIARELLRFDDAEILRKSQDMQEALRRYVPGAIVDELAMGQRLETGEREVSVMFVDIRGYTSYSEDLRADELFSTVNQYTEAVSEVVRSHGGSVVEFNGDGMMTVFGAPRELASKERSAVAAGREILRKVEQLPVEGASRDSLSVGVGIATGEAFVGNIHAVDRLIWSAIGNTTNLAARLQSLTRDLEVAMVIDEPTHLAGGAETKGFQKKSQVPIVGRSERQDLYVLPLGG